MSKQLDPLKTTTLELPFQYKQLIVSGCSFSAGTSNINQARKTPETWAHFVLKKITFDQYANLAMPGGGNTASCLNLLWYLETHFCDPADTLVLFNVTELDRIDTITRDHPDSNEYFSWQDDMNIEWITEGSFLNKSSPFFGALQKNMGYDSTVKFTSMILLLLFEYLVNRGYDFKWMYMSDECRQQIPDKIKKSFVRFEENLVTFDRHISMQSFVKSLGLTVSDTDMHPNIQGHSMIADKMIKELYHV